MIVRVPALGPPPSPVTDQGLRGIRLGRMLWRPLVYTVSSVVPPLGIAVDGAADGSAVEVAIEATATWSDGEPVLARDVVAAAGTLSGTAGVDIVEVSERRVRFVGDDAVRVASGLIPVRVAQGQADVGITSGPYRLVSIDGSKAVLRRLNLPGVIPELPETVEFIALQDLDQALDELRRGGLDAMLEADEAVVAEVIAAPGPAIVAMPDTARVVQVLGFRADYLKLTPDVCAQLAQLIDRNEIARCIYQGLALPASWLPATTTGTIDTDVEVVLLVNAENRLRRTAAECIVATWVESGVSARVDVAPWDTFTSRLRDADFDCFMVSVRDTDDLGDVLGRLTRSQRAHPAPATEVTVHASWTALAPSALRHVPLLVAVTGGGIAC